MKPNTNPKVCLCNGKPVERKNIMNPSLNVTYQMGQTGPAKLPNHIDDYEIMPVGIEVELDVSKKIITKKLQQMGLCVWGLGVHKNRLYQSCHLVEFKNRFYICHYKEVMMLDGKIAKFRSKDIPRRNFIIGELCKENLIHFAIPVSENWNLFTGCDIKTFVLDPTRGSNLFKRTSKVKKLIVKNSNSMELIYEISRSSNFDIQ